MPQLVLERHVDLRYFPQTSIPSIFKHYGWSGLAYRLGTANSTLKLFYSTIIEHDLEEMFLKSSIYNTVIHVNQKVIVQELRIPMMEGPTATKIIIFNTLLERACHDF